MNSHLWKGVLHGVLCVSLVYSSLAISQSYIIEKWNVAETTPQYDLTSVIVEPEIQEYLEEEQSYGGHMYKITSVINETQVDLGEVGTLGFGDGTSLVYINGMHTDRERFFRITRHMSLNYRSLGSTVDAMYGIYNRSGVEGGSDLAKLVCVTVAKNEYFVANESIVNTCNNYIAARADGDYWDVLWGYFPEAYTLLHNDEYVDQNMVMDIAESMVLTASAGRKIILIAHSQANFYIRDALEILSQDSVGRRYLKSIGIIMMGSPVNPLRLPDEIQYSFVANCSDPIADLSGATTYNPLVPQLYQGCIRGGERWTDGTFSNHDPVIDYMDDVAGVRIRDTILSMHQTLTPPHQTFEVNDIVVTNDHLNVRFSPVVTSEFVSDGGTKQYTVTPNSTGVVNAIAGQTNGYFWYQVCFDSETTSVPSGLPGGCGYVASNWLQLSTENVSDQGVVQYPEFKRKYETLTQAPTGKLTLLQGTPSVIPDEDDDILGLGGCINCSTTAPGTFEIYYQHLDCYRGEPRVKLRWTQSSGRERYQIFRGGGVLMGERTYTTFTDRNGLVPGETFIYFIKAVNGDGSRNADNAWRVEIPHTICGAPEPPPPYNGPVPSVTTEIARDVNMTSAVLVGTVDPNDVCGSTQFEHGETASMGNRTSLYAHNCVAGDREVTWNIQTSCDKTIHYRLIGVHNYGEVKGSIMTFETPACSSGAPVSLTVSHDVLSNSIRLGWVEEDKLPDVTVVIIERKIVSDPRPGITIGQWEEMPAQSSGVSEWVDVWTDPQAGGKYCYRIRTWNTASGGSGYSPYSNESCLTIEGMFEYPEPDFPGSVEARVTPGVGVELLWSGGTGLFDIERSEDSGSFAAVQTGVDVDAGNSSFIDVNVVTGKTYCYRFVQNGYVSSEVCNTYFDGSAGTTPWIVSLERLGETDVRIRLSSPNPAEGYFMIWYQDPSAGWVPSGGSAFYTGSAIIEKVVYGDESVDACYQIVQYLNGVETEFSEAMCVSVENTEPPPEEPPVEDPPPPDPDPVATLPVITLSVRGLDIQITWSGGSGDFDLHRSNDGGNSFVFVSSVPARNSRHTDSSVTFVDGEEYCYKLTQGNEFSDTSCIVFEAR